MVGKSPKDRFVPLPNGHKKWPYKWGVSDPTKTKSWDDPPRNLGLLLVGFQLWNFEGWNLPIDMSGSIP